MLDQIINIYSFKLSNEEKSYIYSMKNPNNNLSYNYYILTKNENSIPIIKPTPNAIGLLQKKKYQVENNYFLPGTFLISSSIISKSSTLILFFILLLTII